MKYKVLGKGGAFWDKYLTAIITLLLFSVGASAQFYDSTKLRQRISAYGYEWKNMKALSSFVVPYETPRLAVADKGAIAYENGFFWGYNGYVWTLLGSGETVANGTSVTAGSASWSGVGLIYDIIAPSGFIAGKPFSSPNSTITLGASDPTNKRKDVIYADTANLTGAIPGDPAPSPIKPIANGLSQIELTHVDVAAGATVPTGVAVTMVYDENDPGEWVGASDIAVFDHDLNPYSGDSSTHVTAAGSPYTTYISYQKSLPVSIRIYDYLKLRFRQTSGAIGQPAFIVSFWNNTTQISQDFEVQPGTYGYSTDSVNTYQLIVIPMAGMPVSDTLFDKVYIKTGFVTSNYQYDYIYLLSGENEPPAITDAWTGSGNDRSSTGLNKLGTTDNSPVNVIANNQTAFIIPAEGIVRDTTSNRRIVFLNNGDSLVWDYQDSVGTLGCIKSYDSIGIKWIRDTCAASGGVGWALTGNAGTTAGTNFLGTTDDVDLVFKRFGLEAGRIGLTNTSLGTAALELNLTGLDNTAIGTQALAINASGYGNVAVGVSTLLANTTGSQSIAIGSSAGSINETGDYNISIGSSANVATSSTNHGVSLGYNAIASSNQITISDSIFNIKMDGLGGSDGDVLTRVAGLWVPATPTGGTLTNGNGTTANGTAVDLGGALTQATVIDLAGNTFEISDVANNLGLVIDTNGDVAVSGAFETSNQATFNSTTTFNNTADFTSRIHLNGAAGTAEQALLSQGGGDNTWGDVVTPTGTQTLTNKTLTSPIMTGITLGGVLVTATGTQLNYLSAAAGTTGTGNVMYSASPTATGTLGVAAISATGTIATTGGITASLAITGAFNVFAGSTSVLGHTLRNQFKSVSDGVMALSNSTGTAKTATLQLGGFSPNYAAKTSAYTIVNNDYTIECTANTFTVTLPTAVGITGNIYNIVNSGAGTITVGTTSSQTFVNVAGTPTTVVMAVVGNVMVQSNGANWMQLN